MFDSLKNYLRLNDSVLSEFLFCRYYEKREKNNLIRNKISTKKGGGKLSI